MLLFNMFYFIFPIIALPMFKINYALVLQNMDYYHDFAVIILLYPMGKMRLVSLATIRLSMKKKINFKYQSKFSVFWVEIRMVENRLKNTECLGFPRLMHLKLLLSFIKANICNVLLGLFFNQRAHFLGHSFMEQVPISIYVHSILCLTSHCQA